MNPREIILEILLELEANPAAFSNELIGNVLDKYSYYEQKDKAFIKKVSQGTVERRIQIDYILGLFSSVPVRKLKKQVRAILRMSIYQIMWMDHVPDSAACNEAVKLAKKKKFGSLSGFINGILRAVVRSKNEITYPPVEDDPVQAFSVQYSMPEFITKLLLDCYGVACTDLILNAFLQPAAMHIRWNQQWDTARLQQLEQEWKDCGATVLPHPYLTYASVVTKAEGAASLAGFEEGAFQIQDVSSMLVGELAGRIIESLLGENSKKHALKVMDVCAAPGGKSLHIAEQLQNAGTVYCFDQSDYKVDKIQENIERSGFNNIVAAVQDAREPIADCKETADLVLADVPCSGLGVIGRKPDIKYHVTQESLAEITKLQKEILENVVSYVKPGGYLIYSTCTMNPMENQNMVQWLEENTTLQPVDLTQVYSHELVEKLSYKNGTNDGINAVSKDCAKDAAGDGTLSMQKGWLQLVPGIHETDGFFVSLLRKKGNVV